MSKPFLGGITMEKKTTLESSVEKVLEELGKAGFPIVVNPPLNY
jgi:hypothetical protein